MACHASFRAVLRLSCIECGDVLQSRMIFVSYYAMVLVSSNLTKMRCCKIGIWYQNASGAVEYHFFLQKKLRQTSCNVHLS